MLRSFVCLVLLGLVSSCSKSPGPLSPKVTDPVALQETDTEREIRLVLATPEGRAIDLWMRVQGFERCSADQAIARTDGVDSDLQLPYWNAVRKEKGVLSRAFTQGKTIFGAVVIRPTESGV